MHRVYTVSHKKLRHTHLAEVGQVSPQRTRGLCRPCAQPSHRKLASALAGRTSPAHASPENNGAAPDLPCQRTGESPTSSTPRRPDCLLTAFLAVAAWLYRGLALLRHAVGGDALALHAPLAAAPRRENAPEHELRPSCLDRPSVRLACSLALSLVPLRSEP